MSNFQYESEFSEASINTLDDRRREIRFNDGERAVIVCLTTLKPVVPWN